MEKRAFINRIRSLFSIDGDRLPELSLEQQRAFLRDPLTYFLNTGEGQSDAIMREVERRQASPEPAAKAPRAKKAKAQVAGQRELLLPITGGREEAVAPAKAAGPRRKVG